MADTGNDPKIKAAADLVNKFNLLALPANSTLMSLNRMCQKMGHTIYVLLPRSGKIGLSSIPGDELKEVLIQAANSTLGKLVSDTTPLPPAGDIVKVGKTLLENTLRT